LSNKETTLLNDFRSAKIQKPTEEVKAACKILAKIWAYNLAYYPANGAQFTPEKKPRPTNAKTAPQHIEEFMQAWYKLPNNQLLKPEYATYFTEVSKALDPELKLVFDKDPRPEVKLNAVIFMSEIAKGPNPAQVNTFLQIINEKLNSPAYKLYAFKGLRNILLQRDAELLDKSLIEDPKVLETISKDLEAILMNKAQWAGETPDVIQYVRRTVVQALGAVPVTVVRIRRDEILARPLLPLFRVMVADPAIQPPPSLSERFEALIGIMSMRFDASINLDVLAYGVDRTMLEIISAQGEQASAKSATIPWKYNASRLQWAANAWTRNGRIGKELKNENKPEYIWDLAPILDPLAKELAEKGLEARLETGPLSEWQLNKKPINTTLFKDDPTSTFNLIK
jgi:hypothetical protein